MPLHTDTDTVRWRDGVAGRRKARSGVLIALLIALSVALVVVPARDAAADGSTRRIVILNATDPYLPAFLALDGALRGAILSESRVPAELYAEALDMHRFPRKLLDADVVARQALDRYADRLDVQYLVGLSVADTVAAVRALPPDAAVLYLSIFRDGDGEPRVPREVLTQIAAASAVPVFGMFETYVGHGIVAGSIASFEAQGRETGRLVAHLLNGDDPAGIGVQPPVPSGCIADWRQLQVWGIDEALLPAGCDLRFRKVTTWDRYHRPILAALAVILAQAVLILALTLNHRGLRKAQASLADECGLRAHAEALAVQLRERLARFSKQRSLGTMATSIAHEINQPLAAIQNYAQAVSRRLRNGGGDMPKVLELLTKIEGQAERAGAITQRVRSLVSSGDLRLRPVSLCPVLEQVVRMMEPEIEQAGCRIECEGAPGLPEVLADPLQVQLVLVNLLRNSLQAVCGSDGGDKRLSVDVRPLDDQKVQVSVTDHGAGVPAEQGADIFDPLYSGRSGGMGMGLPISRSIIEAHGGRLWHEPNPGGGAVFRFTLQVAGA